MLYTGRLIKNLQQPYCSLKALLSNFQQGHIYSKGFVGNKDAV